MRKSLNWLVVIFISILLLCLSGCGKTETVRYKAEKLGECVIALPVSRLANQSLSSMSVSVRPDEYALASRLIGEGKLPADAKDIHFIPEEVSLTVRMDRNDIQVKNPSPAEVSYPTSAAGGIVVSWEKIGQNFVSCELLPATSAPTSDVVISASGTALYRVEYKAGSSRKTILVKLTDLAGELTVEVKN